MTLTAVHDTQKTEGLMQVSYVSSDFTNKLLNFKNASLADNEIDSLIDTTVRHEEPSGQTSSLNTIPISVIPEITSNFTTTIPTPHPFFNPLPQQATPTPTPTTSKITTSFLALLNFSSVFNFNDRITYLEKDMSEMKQVDRYSQAISSILAIVDHYIDNKQGEAIQQAIKSHIAECIEEALTDMKDYIDLIDTSVRAIIREESSSQQKSTYEAALSLSEFELAKILPDKMEEHKSYLRADYKRELYDALVKSYNTDKDLFEKYGTKRRKSSKDAESSRDPKSKESKSTRSSKGTSNSQHKSSGKSFNAEEPSYTVDDAKGQSQTWIINIARAEKPPTLFDELMDTPIKSSAYVMNQLNITNMTQELLVGPAFNLLKGTCKSRTQLEYHFEEYFKATTERLDWHNPEGKQYPFNLCKPLPLILNHRGRHVIPFDYFINNDLEYLKGGSLTRKYSTFVTKTKAATYEGPKHQQFYGFSSNRPSSKDVYFRKQIIAVTGLKIMKWYVYGHLDEIKVRKEDRQLYTFKEGFDLKGYSDSDKVGCNMDRKSTSGACQILSRKLVCWSAKKQQSMAMFVDEAEYVAARCCANILSMKSQLSDYDIYYKMVPIFCDNTSAIAISNNPVLHSRTKHIDKRYHFIKNHILKGDIELHFIPI
nr:retrovirus-related Pol polyprotein from transposon TNT 1-94 [Tanacetum cinerariifolium]